MKKRNSRGFTLIEMLVALVVVVLLVTGIGIGMNAATKSYKESTFQSNSGTLSDILTTSISDVLRYSEKVSGPGTDFTFNNSDYKVKNCSLQLNGSGYLVLHTNDADFPLVNDGAYADSLKLTEFEAEAHEAENGYYFDVSYTIQDVSDPSLSASYSFRVRQVNANLPDGFDKSTDSDEEEDEPTVDADTITIIYDQNTPTTESPLFTDIFGNRTRIITKILDPTKGTSFSTYNGKVSRKWYKFTGWNTLPNPSEANPGTAYKAGEKVTLTTEQVNTYAGKELTLYAQWEEIEFTLIYNPNGGTIKSGASTITQKFKYSSRTITLNNGSEFSNTGANVVFDANIGHNNKGGVTGAANVKAACSILGWSTAKTGGTSYSLGTTKFDATTISGFDPEKDTSVTLYARWSTDATVTMPSAHMESSWGKKWTFVGWSTDRYSSTGISSGEVVDVTEDTTYYAQYQIQVGFSNNDGTNTPSAQTHHYGCSDLTLPDKTPLRTGYDFDGWYDSETGGNKLTTAEKMNERADYTITYYWARWTTKGYTITYVLNGGTNSAENPATYDVATETITLKDPTRTGYKFEGWYSDAAFTSTNRVTEIEKGSTGNKTLYAKWSVITYNISYTLNKGTNHSSNPNTYTVEQLPITLNNPTRTGYTFKGWYRDAEFKTSKVTSISAGTTGDLAFYAKWSVNKYTIAFDGNGSTSGSMSSMTDLKYSTTYTLTANSFTKTGYTFAGWNGSNGKSYTDQQKVSKLASKNGATVTLTAQWTPINYNITYTLNGGKNHSSNPATYTIETATITLQAPTRTGYTFAGWYKGTEPVTTIDKGSYGDITLEAKWTVNKYNIAFNGNGNTSGSMSTMTNLEYDTTYSLIPVTFLRTGYNFDCWKDSNGNSYSNQQLVKNLSSANGATVTLKAQWTPITYNITYNLNGGTNHSSNPSTYTIETATITLQAPTRTGYTFSGWYKGTTPVTTINKGSYGNITLEAKWTIKNHTVSLINNYSSKNAKFGVYMQVETAPGSGTYKSVTKDNPNHIYIENKKTVTFSVQEGCRIKYSKIYSYKNNKDYSSTDVWLTYNDSKWANNDLKTVNTDMSFELKYNNSCFSSTTMVRLYNGSQKAAKDITTGDKLLSFNHETGKFEAADVLVIFKSDENRFDKLVLSFSDGSEFEIINEHGLFDYTDMKYVTINTNNVEDYIGHKFIKYDEKSEKNTLVVLNTYKIRTEKDVSYSIISSRNINIITNGLLTVSDEIEGLYNIFKYDPDLKYNAEDKAEKIAEYGISPYSEWSDYITYEHYRGFAIDYSRIAFGEGLTTKEQLLETYRNYLDAIS